MLAGLLGWAALLPGAPAKEMPGVAVFRASGCEHCHGVGGIGSDKGPSLRDVGRRLTRTRIDEQIRKGGQEMPAFEDVTAPEEFAPL